MFPAHSAGSEQPDISLGYGTAPVPVFGAGAQGFCAQQPIPPSGKEDACTAHSELVFSLFPTSWQQAVGVTSSDLYMFGYGSSIQICSVLSRLNAGAAARLGMPTGLRQVSVQEECRDVTCWVTPSSMLECCDTHLVQSAGKGSVTRGLYPLQSEYERHKSCSSCRAARGEQEAQTCYE